MPGNEESGFIQASPQPCKHTLLFLCLQHTFKKTHLPSQQAMPIPRHSIIIDNVMD